MKLMLALTIVIVGLGSVGCKKNTPRTPKAPQDAKAISASPSTSPKPDAEPTQPPEEADDANTQDTKSGEPADRVEPPKNGQPPAKGKFDLETMRKAYLEAYCAQRQGATEELVKIYKRYGFEHPKAWSDAWLKAAENLEFMAKVTHEATRKCP